ncbi:hypothetical protein MPSEU_000215300 [Mayamaea pseudoterrestris]|nr:hypothetical protein MPSEU_000215300 [Mayamaea pseudoterrestris]
MTSPQSYGQTSSTLWGPHLLNDGDGNNIEVSVHTLPKPLQREFNHVFHESNMNLDGMSDNEDAVFLAIPTNQQARVDLVAVGDHIEQEKDRLLNVFMDFARVVCHKLKGAGYWSDFIDPCSGLPMLTLDCSKVYSEVDGMECCLGYKSYNAGFCKILTHPRWGSSVYPATIFCYAPKAVVIEIITKTYPLDTK